MMDDLISRQAAIDAIDTIGRTSNWKAAMAVTLAGLPPAQHDIVEVVRCKDCKHHGFGKPGMVYCQNQDCFVSEDFFCKDGERSVNDGSAIIPSSGTDKPDHS